MDPLEMKDRLSSSLAILRQATHHDRLEAALGTLCLQYGLSHMTFLVASVRRRPERFPYFCTTYPRAWTEAYVDRDYFDIDPVIDILRWGQLPVDWSLLDWRSSSAAHLLREAARHNIGRQGLTIPVRGPEGERCLFSVTSSRPRRDWIRLLPACIHDLIILSHYLHEAVLAAAGLRDSAQYRELSGREQRCLELLAEGNLSKQIAAIQGISESAVKQYLRSARRKLGAATSHQAVARASFFELISL